MLCAYVILLDRDFGIVFTERDILMFPQNTFPFSTHICLFVIGDDFFDTVSIT